MLFVRLGGTMGPHLEQMQEYQRSPGKTPRSPEGHDRGEKTSEDLLRERRDQLMWHKIHVSLPLGLAL